jgi:hypothetical protein
VTNIAGVEDELAREIPKCLKEMATDMEAAFQDDQDHREDDKTQGYSDARGGVVDFVDGAGAVSGADGVSDSKRVDRYDGDCVAD